MALYCLPIAKCELEEDDLSLCTPTCAHAMANTTLGNTSESGSLTVPNDHTAELTYDIGIA
jgi:hypothetical protein